MRKRAAIHWHAGSWLAGLIIAAIACGIVALAMTEGRTQAGPQGAPSPVLLCGPYADFVAQLAGGYGEVPVARGQIGPDALIVVLASPDSFTVLRVQTDGTACLLTGGSGWEDLSTLTKGQGL